MSIITLDEYKDYIGSKSPASDDKLNTIVDFVNDLITQYCNTSFLPQVVTGARMTASTPYSIILPKAPIISVENINVVAVDNTTLTLVDPTTYIVDTELGIVNIVDRRISFPCTAYTMSVDYTHGHTLAPAAVFLAAIELVQHYDKKGYRVSKSFGSGESVDYADPQVIPLHIRVALDLYKVL